MEAKQPIEKVKCTKCDHKKPRTEFHKNRKARNGLYQWCKECTNANSRRIRAELRAYFHPGEEWDISKQKWLLKAAKQ